MVPGSPTAIPASGRIATFTPSVIASSHGPVHRSRPLPRSSTIWAKSSRRTISAVTSVMVTRSHRHAGRAAKICGRSRRPGRIPAKVSGSPPTFSGCARAITGTRRAIPRNGLGWRTTGARSSTRRIGRRIWTTQARMLSLSARVPPRRRLFRRSRLNVAMSRCCSARRPISGRAAMRSRSRMSCASWISTRHGSTRSYARKSCTTKPSLPTAHSPNRRPSSRNCWRRFVPIWAPITTLKRISRRNTGHGGSASPSFPTAIS